MKYNPYERKHPQELDKTVGQMKRGKYTDKPKVVGEDSSKWAPDAEEGGKKGWDRTLQERLTAFQHEVDAILTLKIPGKPEEERIRMMREALERQRLWAKGIDKHCHGEKPAESYLDEKIRTLGGEDK